MVCLVNYYIAICIYISEYRDHVLFAPHLRDEGWSSSIPTSNLMCVRQGASTSATDPFTLVKKVDI